MGGVTKRNGKYLVRFRGPDRRERSKTFDRKVDADAYLGEQRASMRRGDWVDPSGARTVFASIAEDWLSKKTGIKPSTLLGYEDLLYSRVLPQWEAWSVGRITVSEAQAWQKALAEVPLSPSRINKCQLVLRQVLDEAVAQGKLGKNPLHSKQLKRVKERRPKPEAFTAEEVYLLAAEMPEHYKLFTEFLCYTGVRMSEAVAIKVLDLNFTRRVLNVERATVQVGNEFHTGTPKNGETREVPLTDAMIEKLKEHIKGKKKSDWLFPDPSGEQMIANRYREIFSARVKRIGKPQMTPHACRDTAASLAIQAHASVKTVSVMLGHADAAITLSRYTAFFPQDYDALRNTLAQIASDAEKNASKRAKASKKAIDKALPSDEAPF